MTTCFAVRSSNTLITFNLPADLSQSLATTLISPPPCCGIQIAGESSQEGAEAGEQVAPTVKLIRAELAPMIGTIEWTTDANYAECCFRLLDIASVADVGLIKPAREVALKMKRKQCFADGCQADE
jgi:hypothetical protein